MLVWIALAGVLMVAGALWYLSINDALYLSAILATIGGVFLSTLLGCGLFAAAFFSDKSGHDARRERAPPARHACRLIAAAKPFVSRRRLIRGPRERHMAVMLIETEATPNPATLKFLPGRR
jgi:hypothetical protein